MVARTHLGLGGCNEDELRVRRLNTSTQRDPPNAPYPSEPSIRRCWCSSDAVHTHEVRRPLV